MRQHIGGTPQRSGGRTPCHGARTPWRTPRRSQRTGGTPALRSASPWPEASRKASTVPRSRGKGGHTWPYQALRPGNIHTRTPRMPLRTRHRHLHTLWKPRGQARWPWDLRLSASRTRPGSYRQLHLTPGTRRLLRSVSGLDRSSGPTPGRAPGGSAAIVSNPSSTGLVHHSVRAHAAPPTSVWRCRRSDAPAPRHRHRHGRLRSRPIARR
jgi:hypothetical protein